MVSLCLHIFLMFMSPLQGPCTQRPFPWISEDSQGSPMFCIEARVLGRHPKAVPPLSRIVKMPIFQNKCNRRRGIHVSPHLTTACFNGSMNLTMLLTVFALFWVAGSSHLHRSLQNSPGDPLSVPWTHSGFICACLGLPLKPIGFSRVSLGLPLGSVRT